MSEPRKKTSKSKQTAIGYFYQPAPKRKKNGSITQTHLPKFPPQEFLKEGSIRCKAPKCPMKFTCTQGLGSHLNSCTLWKNYVDQNENENGMILYTTSKRDGTGRKNDISYRRQIAVFENQRQFNDNDQNEEQEIPNQEEVDGRMNNRGSSVRNQYTPLLKWEIIEQFEIWAEERKEAGEINNVTTYLKEKRLPTKFKDFLGKNAKTGWRNEHTKAKFFRQARDLTVKNLKVPSRGRANTGKYLLMESELKTEMKERRLRKARVSSNWLKMRAKQIANIKYPASTFKASNGWLLRFMRRNNIKFRNRKNVKAESAEEKRQKIMQWHSDLRLKVLPYREGHVGSYHPHYGRFPPERRYNMDQIPMPFIVDQNTTFTFEDDEHVQVRGTGAAEGLNKRQYTAHVFINASLECSTSYGYIDMICRGTGKRISSLEKESYNENVNVRWQPKAWVDRKVMIDIARDFV